MKTILMFRRFIPYTFEVKSKPFNNELEVRWGFKLNWKYFRFVEIHRRKKINFQTSSTTYRPEENCFAKMFLLLLFCYVFFLKPDMFRCQQIFRLFSLFMTGLPWKFHYILLYFHYLSRSFFGLYRQPPTVFDLLYLFLSQEVGRMWKVSLLHHITDDYRKHFIKPDLWQIKLGNNKRNI